MQVIRYDPGRAAGQFAILVDLRQGHETQLGVASGDELVGLGNALTFDDLGFGGFGQAHFAQYLSRCQTVGRGFGVGDGQVLILIGLEHLALAVDITILGRPQRQCSDRVGEARTLDGVAFLLEFCRRGVVSREEYLERRAILDLRIDLTGSAKRGDELVAGVLLEVSGYRLDRRGEIGRHGDLHFVGRRMGCSRGGKGQHGELENGAQRGRSHETAP